MKPLKQIVFSLLFLVAMLACSSVSNFMATSTPVATNTPVPSRTPLPSPTSDAVLFEDSEFTNSCSTDSTADVERSVENGVFSMHIITPKYVGWTECTHAEYSDLIVEVDGTLVDGPVNSMYGVLFRYGLQGDEFYVFAVSGDGFYTLIVDGSKHTKSDVVVDWTEASAIKKGQDTNHLKVIATGDNIEYYVNDQLLGKTTDDRLSTGTIGFFAGSTADGGVRVSFDNLKISKP